MTLSGALTSSSAAAWIFGPEGYTVYLFDADGTFRKSRLEEEVLVFRAWSWEGEAFFLRGKRGDNRGWTPMGIALGEGHTLKTRPVSQAAVDRDQEDVLSRVRLDTTKTDFGLELSALGEMREGLQKVRIAVGVGPTFALSPNGKSVAFEVDGNLFWKRLHIYDKPNAKSPKG